MSRLSRKNRTDIVFKGCGGITDAVDDVVKQVWRINDEEYDYICEHATDEELDFFMISVFSPTPICIEHKRKAIMVIDKLITDYKATLK